MDPAQSSNTPNQQPVEPTQVNSQQHQPSKDDQKFSEVLIKEIKDQQSNLGSFIRSQIITQAAITFVQELREHRLFMAQKQTQTRKKQSIKDKSFVSNQSHTSSQEESDEEDSHPSRSEKFPKIYFFDSDQSIEKCSYEGFSDNGSDGSSFESIYTFQGDQILFEKFDPVQPKQTESEKFEDIILETGKERKTSDLAPEVRKVKKLEKKLKRKVNLQKAVSGPKLNSFYAKKQKQLEKKIEENKDTKGIRKLQKMLEKMKLHQEKEKQQNEQKSQEKEQKSSESEKEDGSSASQNYEDNELDSDDIQDFQSLRLDSKEQENVTKAEEKSKYNLSGAMKKVKVQENENYSKKFIYINVKIDFNKILDQLLQQKEEGQQPQGVDIKLETSTEQVKAVKQKQENENSQNDWV